MDTDIKNIESLLDEGKFDDVKAIINSIANAQFSLREKGEAFVGFASIYMDISNAINTRYRDTLQQAIAGMKELNKAEVSHNEKIKLAEVRGELNK